MPLASAPKSCTASAQAVTMRRDRRVQPRMLRRADVELLELLHDRIDFPRGGRGELLDVRKDGPCFVQREYARAAVGWHAGIIIGRFSSFMHTSGGLRLRRDRVGRALLLACLAAVLAAPQRGRAGLARPPALDWHMGA